MRAVGLLALLCAGLPTRSAPPPPTNVKAKASPAVGAPQKQVVVQKAPREEEHKQLNFNDVPGIQRESMLQVLSASHRVYRDQKMEEKTGQQLTTNPYAIAGSTAANPKFYDKLAPTINNAPDIPSMGKNDKESMQRADKYVETKTAMMLGEPLSPQLKENVDGIVAASFKKEEDRITQQADFFKKQADTMMGSLLETGMNEGAEFESLLQISSMSNEEMEEAKRQAMEEMAEQQASMDAGMLRSEDLDLSKEDLDNYMSILGMNPFAGAIGVEPAADFKYDRFDGQAMDAAVDRVQSVMGFEFRGSMREHLDSLAGRVLMKETGGMHIEDFSKHKDLFGEIAAEGHLRKADGTPDTPAAPTKATK